MTSLKDHMAQTAYRAVNGYVQFAGHDLTPVEAHRLQGIYLDEGSSAAVRGDVQGHRSAVELYWSLSDAMTAAANHSPERWRDALGFLPSHDRGCAA